MRRQRLDDDDDNNAFGDDDLFGGNNNTSNTAKNQPENSAAAAVAPNTKAGFVSRAQRMASSAAMKQQQQEPKEEKHNVEIKKNEEDIVPAVQHNVEAVVAIKSKQPAEIVDEEKNKMNTNVEQVSTSEEDFSSKKNAPVENNKKTEKAVKDFISNLKKGGSGLGAWLQQKPK